MKYAAEIREYMAARPGERCNVRHLVRVIAPFAYGNVRASIRRQVLRTLKLMVECGAVVEEPRQRNGGHARYSWVEHQYGLRLPAKR